MPDLGRRGKGVMCVHGGQKIEAFEINGLRFCVKVGLRFAGQALAMSSYLRPRIPGASVFFTVTLADHTSWLLVKDVEALRYAVRITKAECPFQIDAWVVLPATCTRFGPCPRVMRITRPGGG